MAYKVFTNGSPLPASDLNTFLMNQSVIVFSNSTARSAALTSPTEGMVTYLEDTNKVEVWTGAAWTDINDNSAAIPKSTVTTTGDLIVANGNASVTRLGIGANGTYLTSNGTTASWGTISAGGMTLISTTSLSGASVAITSIPQTYLHLQLVIRDLLPDTDTSIQYRYNNNSGTVYRNAAASSAPPGEAAPSGASINLFPSTVDSAVTKNTAILNIFDYANTTTWKISHLFSMGVNGTTNTSAVFNNSMGLFYSTSGISEINLFPGSGNFTSGTALLYGVK